MSNELIKRKEIAFQLYELLDTENALRNIDLSEQSRAFYLGEIQAAKYFVRWELPAIQTDIALLNDMDDSGSEMQAEWF